METIEKRFGIQKNTRIRRRQEEVWGILFYPRRFDSGFERNTSGG